jgi:hypothetical protein
MRFVKNISIMDTPSEANHAARIVDVKNLISQHYKVPVNVATASARPVVTAYDTATQTLVIQPEAVTANVPEIDDYPLEAGDRILLWQQADPETNGIYELVSFDTSGTPAKLVLKRSSDFNGTEDVNLLTFKVISLSGSTNAGKTFLLLAFDTSDFEASDKVFAVDNAPPDTADKVKAYRGTFTTVDGTYTYDITHNLGRRPSGVQIYNAATNELVMYDYTMPDTDKITIDFGSTVTAGETYNVIVLA